MYIIGCVLLIVVLVVAIRFMIKASKASPAIYEQYQGVFGKGTAIGLLCLGPLQIIAGLGIIVGGLIESESVSEIVASVLFGLIIISIFSFGFYWLIKRAKSRCPEELKEGLYMAIFIATLGVFGTYCRYSWNAACGILSIIPGFGWVMNFIITKDTSIKKDLVKTGEQLDKEYEEQLEQEKQERRVEEERQIEERKEMEEDLRKRVWKEQGRTDVVFNSDSSMWRYSDEDSWRKTEKKTDGLR